MELEVKNQISLTYNEMGIVLFQRDQFEEAITLFNESIQFKNNDWGVLANRGDCFRSLGKIDLALKDYY
jgi:Flp pilus assembly protein TadD